MRLLPAIQTLTLALAVGQAAFAAETRVQPPSALQIKSESLAYLQNLREQNVKRLREIDQSLRSKMHEDGINDVEREIAKLRDERHEHLLRQDFLSRLIFQVDTRFGGGDLRLFLKSALSDMATNDVTSAAATDPSLWKFMKYAAEALGHLPERREDILAFLEGYMEKSIANPANPKQYLDSRNYTNGLESQSGAPLRRDEVGAIADKRLREAKAPAAAAQRRKR